MKVPDETFRNELLELEKPNAGYKNKYEKEIKAMLEKKLSCFWRVVFSVGSVIGLLIAVPFVHMACSQIGGPMQSVIRTVAVFGAVLALAWAAMTAWIAARGKLNFRALPTGMAVTAIALGFSIIVYFVFAFVLPIAWEAPTDSRAMLGLHLALMGFFLIATVGLCMILGAVHRTEFRTREKLLEIEYRLCDLGEKIQGKTSV